MAPLPPATYHDLEIQSFLRFVENGKQKGTRSPPWDSENEECYFLPYPDLRQYFADNERLSTLLKAALKSQGPLSVAQSDIRAGYSNVFATLISIGRGEYIEIFVRRDGLSDAKLPFYQRPVDFPQTEPDFFEEFYKRQWTFCAPPMTYQRSTEWDVHRTLPIVGKVALGSGGSSVTYKIDIHPAYDRLDARRTADEVLANPFAHTYVLKVFNRTQGDDRRQYKKEIEAFIHVRNSGTREPCLIGFFGGFEQGDTFNIILEYANGGTLEDFFHQKSAPYNGPGIHGFWDSLLPLIRAVSRIHNITYEDSVRYQGWHQDIKPHNILVCTRHGKHKFKLADLGLSHFQIQYGKLDMGRDAHGTQSYGAPECYRPDDISEGSLLNVTSKVDIWSLGCVLSEAATWLVCGSFSGVESFRTARAEETKVTSGFHGPEDCFHNGIDVLTCVGNHHESLKRQTRQNDSLTGPIIDMIGDMLESQARLRGDADLYWRRAQRMLERSQDRMKDDAASANDLIADSRSMTMQTASPQAIARDWSVQAHVRNALFAPDSSHPHSGQMTPEPEQVQADGGRLSHTESPDQVSEHQSRNTTPTNMNGRPNIWPTSAPTVLRSDTVTARHTPPMRQGTTPPAPIEARAPHRNTTTVLSQVENLDFHNGNPNLSPAEPTNPARYSESNLPLRRKPVQPSQTFQQPFQYSPPVPQGYESSRDPFVDQMSPIGQQHDPWTTNGAAEYPTHATAHGPNFNVLPPTPGPVTYPPHNQAMHTPYMTYPSNQPIYSPQSGMQAPHPGPPPHPPSSAAPRSNGPRLPYLSVDKARAWKSAQKGHYGTKMEHEHLMEELNNRDHVFLFDDSTSMHQHWQAVLDLLDVLAYRLKSADPDGLELFFSMSEGGVKKKHTKQCLEAVTWKKPNVHTERISNIAIRLSSILGEYEKKLRKQPSKVSSLFSKSKQSELRPMNLYVFTDGKWQPDSEPDGPIRSLVKTLVEVNKLSGQVGIQLIQFGNDPQGSANLRWLDSELGIKPDIVDTEPANGNFWKILLGATNKWFDNSDVPQYANGSANTGAGASQGPSEMPTHRYG